MDGIPLLQNHGSATAHVASAEVPPIKQEQPKLLPAPPQPGVTPPDGLLSAGAGVGRHAGEWTLGHEGALSPQITDTSGSR